MSDYLDKNIQPSMPQEIATPSAKEQYEKEARQQLTNMQNQTPAQPLPDPYAQDEKVIIRNNRAHAQHFVPSGGGEPIIVPGQVQNEKKGPFAFVSKRLINSEMPLMLALEQQANGRRAPLSIIDKETYSKEYRIFDERRKEREKMDSKHRALNMDEMDSEQEDFKVHYNVLENVQPNQAVPDSGENETKIGPSINFDED